MILIQYRHWAVLAVLLMPWLWLKTQVTSHPDILWLVICLRRILDGGTMSEVAYEVNPPLSMLVYGIPVLLERSFGGSIDLLLLGQTFLIFAAGLVMLLRLLPHVLDRQSVGHSGLVAGYIIASTVMSSMAFGERDQMIAMILPPFVLLQVLMTQKRLRIGYGEVLFMVLSAVLLLLKPHYGFIPIGLLLHRAWRQRSPAFLRDADFLILSLCALAYAAVIWIFFRDYLYVVLPDVIEYYRSSMQDKHLPQSIAALSALVVLLHVMAGRYVRDPGLRRLSTGLCLLALSVLLPVAMQGTGFFYHFLPFATLACMVLGILMESLLAKTKLPRIGMIIVLVVIAHLYAPLNFSYAKSRDYAALPLPAAIVEMNKDADQKGFYLAYRHLALAPEIEQYTGVPYASRFAALWFITQLDRELARDRAGLLDQEESKRVRSDYMRFGRMMAADIKRYRPPVILTLKSSEADRQADPLQFFMQSPALRKVMEGYEYSHDLRINENQYYGFGYTDRWAADFVVLKRKSD